MSDPRVPMQNLESEECVIGGILVHARAYPAARAAVDARAFYHPALRAVFEAMVALDEDSKPIDALTVYEQMRRSDTASRLAGLGGADFLTSLMSKVITVENIAYHAKVIARCAEAREVAAGLQEVVAKSFAGGDPEEFLELADARMLSLVTRETRDPRAAHVSEIARDVTKVLEKRYERSESVTGISTGFAALDAILCGLQDGDLIIVGARPSMGKSALMLSTSVGASRSGAHGLIFSLEMSRQSLGERLFSAEAKVDGTAIRSGRLETPEWVRLAGAASRIAELPVWIDESPRLTVAEIRARARRWRGGVARAAERAFIAVDYLQLVDGSGRSDEDRQREVSEISRGLKSLAKELNLPVVALSQLNRSLESRADKRPMLSDLRESGALEQDADVIAFVYRDEVYHDGSDCAGDCERCRMRGIAEVIVAKQRNGPTGTVRLGWQKEYARFVDLVSAR